MSMAPASSARVLTDDDELVTTEAAHGVGWPDARRQSLGDRRQDEVADAVAELVVDQLEIVEVDEQNPHGALGPADPGQRVLHPVAHEHPVGGPGQGVVDDLVGELDTQCPFGLVQPGVGHGDGGVLGEQRHGPKVVLAVDVVGRALQDQDAQDIATMDQGNTDRALALEATLLGDRPLDEKRLPVPQHPGGDPLAELQTVSPSVDTTRPDRPPRDRPGPSRSMMNPFDASRSSKALDRMSWRTSSMTRTEFSAFPAS